MQSYLNDCIFNDTANVKSNLFIYLNLEFLRCSVFDIDIVLLRRE